MVSGYPRCSQVNVLRGCKKVIVKFKPGFETLVYTDITLLLSYSEFNPVVLKLLYFLSALVALALSRSQVKYSR